MQKKKGSYDYKKPSILIWKMAIAAGLSWELAKLAGSDHPYLAPISVILCLQVTINHSIRYSFHRIVGTFIGVIVIAQLASHFSVNGWAIAILILVGTFLAKWLKLDETVLHQVALSILLVFVFEHKSGDYGLDRVRDTIVGAIVALLIHTFIFPPNFADHAIKKFQALSSQLEKNLSEISNCLLNGCKKNEMLELKNQVELLLKELHTTKSAIDKASKSLKYNPFGKRNQTTFQKYKEQFNKMQFGYTYIAQVIGILLEWSALENISQQDKRLWSDQLNRLSTYFASFEMEQNAAVKIDSLSIIVPPPFGPNGQKFQTIFYYETEHLIHQLKKQ